MVPLMQKISVKKTQLTHPYYLKVDSTFTFEIENNTILKMVYMIPIHIPIS